MRIPSFVLFAFALPLLACGDDTGPGGGSTGGGGTGGEGANGGQGGDGGQSSTGGQGGAGGQPSSGGGGEGGMGGGVVGFGPCHGFTDDFSDFDPSSTSDYWAVDGNAVATSGADPAVELDPAEGANWSGLYSDVGAPAANCFTSVRIEQIGTGFTTIEMLEATGTGPKLTMGVDETGHYEVANIINAQGDGDTLGSGDVQELRALRIQVLDGVVLFELNDGGTWTEVATLTELPDWLSGDVNLAFGTSDFPGTISVFDDFNLDDPTLD